VNAATTPGAASAPDTSMARIRACAMGDRTKNTWHAPGSATSSV
jgi:hypothetical protein